jgi:CubicO group peptidase (beta-lactamase class C family)
VARYLPDSVRVPREITLLGLATHHSGLSAMPDNMEPADYTNPYADYSVARMYAFLSGHPIDANPSYQYSNIGYGVLGHALARAAGTSYEQLVRERLLAPLRMSRTSIELRGELAENMAKGHNRRGGVVPYWDLPTLAGAGAFRSNIGDMMTYLAANLREPATGLERAMRTTHRLQRTVSDSTGIGVGWQIRTVGGRRIVWKDGGTAGFQTFVGFDPERRVGVVVLGNSALEVDDIGFHLIDRDLPLIDPPAIPRRMELPASVLRAYTGEYAFSPDLSVVVTLENGELFAQDTGDRKYPIFAESDTRFFYDVADAWITFARDESGAVTGLVFTQAGDEKPARKVR